MTAELSSEFAAPTSHRAETRWDQFRNQRVARQVASSTLAGLCTYVATAGAREFGTANIALIANNPNAILELPPSSLFAAEIAVFSSFLAIGFVQETIHIRRMNREDAGLDILNQESQHLTFMQKLHNLFSRN